MKKSLGFIAVIVIGYGLDQWTKWLARIHLGGPNGELDYSKFVNVFGDWFLFRLVYNHGAAFGMRPQNLVPFLHPTVFYGILSIFAIGMLAFYFKKLPIWDTPSRYGIVCILSGAFGNLTDRLIFHKVTDFLEMGIPQAFAEKTGIANWPDALGFHIPGITSRWPTYNIADSMVCIGVGLLLLAPLFHKWFKLIPQEEQALQTDSPAEPNMQNEKETN